MKKRIIKILILLFVMLVIGYFLVVSVTPKEKIKPEYCAEFPVELLIPINGTLVEHNITLPDYYLELGGLCIPSLAVAEIFDQNYYFLKEQWEVENGNINSSI